MKRKFSSLMLCATLLGSSCFLAACSSKDENAPKQESSSAKTQSTEQIEESQVQKESLEKTEEAKTKEEGFSETVVYDQDGLTITALGIEDGFLGKNVKFLIENNADKSYTVQADSVSINGSMVNPIMSAEVAPGKMSNDDMLISTSTLEEQGIESVDQIEMRFRIFESDNFVNAQDTDMFTLTFKEGGEQSAAPEGDVIVDQDGIKILCSGLDPDGVLGPGVKLYIENNTDQPLTVQSRDASVNGFMVNTLISCELMPHKSASDSMTILKSSLEDNGIEQVDSIEVTFHIFNTDDWSQTFDVGPVTIDF